MAPHGTARRPPMNGKTKMDQIFWQQAHHGQNETDTSGHQCRADEDPQEFAQHDLPHSDRRREHRLEDELERHPHIEAVTAFEESCEKRRRGNHAGREILRVSEAVDLTNEWRARGRGLSSSRRGRREWAKYWPGSPSGKQPSCE